MMKTVKRLVQNRLFRVGLASMNRMSYLDEGGIKAPQIQRHGMEIDFYLFFTGGCILETTKDSHVCLRHHHG